MNALAHTLSKILVPLFFIGMVGSVLVVIFTVIRDLRQVFVKDDKYSGPEL
jgi:hypothetical protein